jgi:hypothetical protein
MKSLVCAAAALLLAACQTCPKPEVTEVKVPVHVPCVKQKADKPQYETMAGLADGDLVLALGRNWLLSRKYEGELEATVAGCE